MESSQSGHRPEKKWKVKVLMNSIRKKIEKRRARNNSEWIGQSISFENLIANCLPVKLGVLQVMKYSGKRQNIWQNQLLVLCGNHLVVFPTLLTPQDIRVGHDGSFEPKLLSTRKTKSENVFDLTEPTLSVSVALVITNSALNIDADQTFEWTLSVHRLKGLVLFRCRCRSKEERDSWVSSLRILESRIPLSSRSLDRKVVKKNRLEQAIPATNQCSPRRSQRKPSILSPSHSRKSGSFAIVPSSLQPNVRDLSKEKQDSLLQVLAALESEFELEQDAYFVHAGQTEIAARQESLVRYLVEKISTKSDEKSADLADSALQILQECGWDVNAAVGHFLKSYKLRSRSPPHKTVGSNSKILFEGNPIKPGEEEEAKESDFTCPVCFESSASEKNWDSPYCGHKFCNSCWGSYVKARLDEGKLSLRTKCMEPSCKAQLSHAFFLKHLDGQNLQSRFRKMASDSFVEGSQHVRWCPRPECGTAIELDGMKDWLDDQHLGTVVCKCGFRFCFQCSKPAHEPATCAQMIAWGHALEVAEEASKVQAAPREKQDQALAKRWILYNSRPCPKCKAPIEKSQGCNHMVCSSCRHEFCWSCFGDWALHGSSTGGFFRCNLFLEKEEELGKVIQALKQDELTELQALKEKAKEEKIEFAKQDLAFRKAQVTRKMVAKFQERQDLHNQGGECAMKMLQLVTSSQADPSRDQIFQTLNRALKVVLTCREVLSASCVVCFFLDSPCLTGEWFFDFDPQSTKPDPPPADGPHRALYFAKVGKLEQITERLQHAVEAPAASLNLLNTIMASQTEKLVMARKSTEKKTKSLAERLVNCLAPFREEIFQLSSQALECASDLKNIAEVLHHHFQFVSCPPCPENDIQRVMEERREFVQNGVSAISIIPVFPNRNWLCGLCGMKNLDSTSCAACLTQRVTNIFNANRTALSQQVRSCVSCSADLELPLHQKIPCGCGKKSSISQTLSHRLLQPLKRGQVLIPMETACPECNRNPFVLPENAGKKTLEEKKAERDQEDFELLLSQEMEDLDDTDEGVRKGDKNLDLLCPWGHAIEFTPKNEAPVHDCDVCTLQLPRKDQLIGACRKCNWYTCKRCSEVHGLLSKISHGHRSKRRRRNAVLLNSVEELRNLHLTDHEPEHVLPQESNGWPCSQCTYFNTPNRIRCSMCLTVRARDELDAPGESRVQRAATGRIGGDRARLSPVQSPLPPLTRRYTSPNETSSGESRQAILLDILGGNVTPRPNQPPSGALDDVQSTEEPGDRSDSISMTIQEVSERFQRHWGHIRDEDIYRMESFTSDQPEGTVSFHELDGETFDDEEDNRIDDDDEEEDFGDDELTGEEDGEEEEQTGAEWAESSGDQNLVHRPRLHAVVGESPGDPPQEVEEERGHLASVSSELQLFSPRSPSRRKGFKEGPLILSSSKTTEPFISTCSESLLDKETRRCLTLLKPVRRDPKRAAKQPLRLLPGQTHTIELFWETHCCRATSFNRVTISVHFCNVEGRTSKTEFVVPDTGVCYLKIRDKESLLETFPELRLRAAASENMRELNSPNEPEPDEIKKENLGKTEITPEKNVLRVWMEIEASTVADSTPTAGLSSPNSGLESGSRVQLKPQWFEVGLPKSVKVRSAIFTFV